MKFEYDEDNGRDEFIAALYKYDGGPDLCLGMRGQSGKFVWLYPTGLPSIQGQGFPQDSEPAKKFYSGDKITITF